MPISVVKFSVPWGHRFFPTDLALVEIFLHGKIANLPLPHDAIFEFDVYNTEPWNLPDVYGPASDLPAELMVIAHRIRPGPKKIVKDGYKGYYFVPSSTTRKLQLHIVIKCGTDGGGYWKRVNREHREVRNERNMLVGFKRTFVFHRYTTDDAKDHAEKTDWILNEYSLNSKEFQPWVLCSVRNMFDYSEAYFCDDEDEEFLQEDEQITKLVDGVEEVDIQKASTKQFENAAGSAASLMEEED